MNSIHSCKNIVFNVLAAVLISSSPFLVNGQVITTLAGSQLFGNGGDGGFAIDAELSDPGSLLVDSKGNIYIGDRGNNRIRKINQYGVISTIAGFGSAGMSGDGGPSEKAKVNYPCGMALDAAGDFYFSDTRNNRIRKIDANGIISTVAGTGSSGYNGDGILAVDATLSLPRGIAFDANNNLYIADYNNSRVRMVTPDGIIHTVVGNGKIPSSGIFKENVPATDANLYTPTDVALLPDGSIVISDAGNHIIRKYNPSDSTVSTFAGMRDHPGSAGDDGPATKAMMSRPISLAVDHKGNVYFADQDGNCVRKIDAEGKVSRVAGDGSNPGPTNGDGGLAVDAQLKRPAAIAVDTVGNLYIADFSHRVRYVYLDEPRVDESIRVIPNPCTTDANIFLHSMYEEPANIFLLDAAGRQVSTFVAPTNIYVTLHFDAPGVYFAYAYSKHGKWHGKVVSVQ